MKSKGQYFRLHERIFYLLVTWILLSLTFCSTSDANDKFRVIENATIENATKGVIRVFTLSDSYFDPESDSFSFSSGSGFGVGDPGKETDTFITNWHVIYDENMRKVTKIMYISCSMITRSREATRDIIIFLLMI